MTSTTPPDIAGVGPAASPPRDHRPESNLLAAVGGIAVAFVVTGTTYLLLPDHLDVRTDVVGYPIFHDFNIYRYYYTYLLFGVALPLIAVGTWQIIIRLPRLQVTRPVEPQALISPMELSVDPSSDWLKLAAAAGRVLLVAGTLALEGAVAWGGDARMLLILTVGLAYMSLAVAIVVVGPHGQRPTVRSLVLKLDRVAVLNTLAAPVVLLGLYAVSRQTQVTIAATGRVHSYGWLPAWLALSVALIACGTLIALLRRAASSARLRAIEQSTLVFVVGPVLIFLLVAVLPGDTSPMNVFEDGQLMVGARLLLEGSFPWRDIFLAHGILNDGLLAMVGFKVFGYSYWGYQAGIALLLTPLYWIGIYVLNAYLFKRNWAFLVGTVLVLLAGSSFFFGLLAVPILRFILIPYVLMAFSLFFGKPTWPRAGLFTVLLFIQVIITPEYLFALPAFLAVLIVHDVRNRKWSASRSDSFVRTQRTLVAGAATTVVFSMFLAANHALDDFYSYFRSVLSSHLLSGGVPIIESTRSFRVGMYLPIVLIAVAAFYFVPRLLDGRSLSAADWTMAAHTLFLAVYYFKFLARRWGPPLSSGRSRDPTRVLRSVQGADRHRERLGAHSS